MAQLKSAIDILKLLNKSNCGECREKTCLAFATAVFKGEKQLDECPYLDEEIIKAYGGNVEKLKTLEADQEKAVEALKQKVIQCDFSGAAGRINGTFSNDRLTLKIFGKDFAIDTSGRLHADIHINPYITIPFLMHILHSKGTPVSGNWISIREFSGGQSMQAWMTQRFQIPMKKVADAYTGLFEDLMHIFNGESVGNHCEADIALVLHPFPLVPMLICYWKPEDELDSDLKVFFDQSVEDHLPLEGIYGLCSGLIRMFERLAVRHGGD